MSWDIVIFSSKQKISDIVALNEEFFVPIDFDAILEKHFNIIEKDDILEIHGEDFSINYFKNEELVSNKMFTLYGERALFELIRVSKNYSWQIYDTYFDAMIDLEHPEANGMINFTKHIQDIKKGDLNVLF